MNNIIDRFKEVVEQFPNDDAILYNDSEITYRELDIQSDRVACYLTLHQMAHTHVGVAMQRSSDWIITLMGILKAGAVYVPLDLGHPKERLQKMIQDCDIRFIVYSSSSVRLSQTIPGCCATDMLAYKSGTELPNPTVNDIAYIIYTSGTTGLPKGTPIRHDQVVRMAYLAKEHVYFIHPQERMLQFAGLNFSASMLEVFTVLLNGACLVMANDEERKNSKELLKLVKDKHVSCAGIPPALLAVCPRISLPELKTLVVGGERMAENVKEFWMQERRMVNTYGFTENTVLVAAGAYTEDSPVNDVGTILPGIQSYILDENMMPVPNGMPGELYISGSQLTEGYWKRPELNEQKFISNPFLTNREHTEGRNLRLYGSGDKVIRLANGHLLFLGRLDNQVKIRGMRIELSEIEQCLNRYPGILMSLVTVKEHRGRKMLVAYLQVDQEPDSRKIRAFVSEKLPDYMCPVCYVALKDFPITINRKIDKEHLPEPDWKHSQEWKELPSTPTEREIARIWHEMLDVSTVGKHDNFIALGGDSISVMLMANTVEEEFGLTLKVEDVFSRLDLYVLAKFIDASKSKECKIAKKVQYKSFSGFSPLSSALRNLWSQCVSSTEMNDAYKLALFLTWDNELKAEILLEAWDTIVQEQEVMRMSFPIGDDGKPYICVAPFTHTDIPVKDIEENEFWEAVHELYSGTFNLENGPLHRVCLYRFPNGNYTQVVIIHHLVTDGWSARLLDEKLRNYYEQLLQGNELQIEYCSYQDYVLLSRKQLNDEILGVRKAFWKEYLKDCSCFCFEGKENLKELKRKQGGMKYIPMDGELVEQLEYFCERNAVTPLVVCLCVYQLLLVKYTGQTEFVTGLAVTDRKRLEFQGLLGYFATLLPVRVIKDHNIDLAGYSKRLMNEIVKLMSHSLPLDIILNSLENAMCESSTSRLLRIAFGMEEVRSAINIPEDWISSSSFDMSLIIHKYSGNYSFHVQYATAYFDESFITQFCDSYQAALRFLLNKPSCNVSECPLLSEREIKKRTSAFNFSNLVLPDRNVVEHFEEVAIEQPERAAYCWDTLRMSYGELKEMSDWFAADIQGKATFMGRNLKGASIGIYLEEKRYLLPAILGVLKSGSCYVPLDTALPKERLLFILEDAAVALLLTDKKPDFDTPCEILLINNPEKNMSSRLFHPVKLEPESTAYIIYTSGTTGKPKGIPISHYSLALFAGSQAKIYGLLPDKCVLQYASIGFDASVMEIFPALISKAFLIIPTEHERKDANLLLDLMEREKVYCTLLPPALLSVMPYRSLPYLKTLVVGGESTPSDVMERWRHGRRLVNAYGPTENTVVTTCAEISDDFRSNNIGFPLPGVSCYVLDKNMTLLPNYVPGELYIGGLQLTSGYIKQEKLNQEKFVDNPFACPEDRDGGRNTRLYKSGDKVMRTSEGSFLFLGRMDSQVKVRGFRVELEEIARELESYPNVSNALVMLKEYGNEKRIVAYLLADKDEKVEPEKIRKYLTTRLPSYMVPSVWAVIQEYPLTINGKIDRNALPEPKLLITEDYEAPVTREEKILAKIASELLQVEKVGVGTNLLDMGLTSLQVMELVHDGQKKKVNISVTDVYTGRNIRDILKNQTNSRFHRENETSNEKPLLVLICGYPYFRPFYDRFVARFENDYSFFVFDSFLEYFQDGKPVDVNELVDYYSEVLETELNGKEIYAVSGHCLGGELSILLAERLRITGHPSVKALIIEAFIRRNKNLLMPVTIDNVLLREQGRIVNGVIQSMPEPKFGGEMIVCLATKAPNRFMFETGSGNDDELIEGMWIDSQKNKENWKEIYPAVPCFELDSDHWSVFDGDSLDSLYEIVKQHWNIN